MSIKQLERDRNEYNRDIRPWDVVTSSFMDEVIDTIKEFRDEIKKLRKERYNE